MGQQGNYKYIQHNYGDPPPAQNIELIITLQLSHYVCVAIRTLLDNLAVLLGNFEIQPIV